MQDKVRNFMEGTRDNATEFQSKISWGQTALLEHFDHESVDKRRELIIRFIELYVTNTHHDFENEDKELLQELFILYGILGLISNERKE